MRFLIAGVFLGALLVPGCAGRGPASSERGGGNLPAQGRVLRPAPLTGSIGLLRRSSLGCEGRELAEVRRGSAGHLPAPAPGSAGQLTAAGGGRPRTGYVGIAAALYFASSEDLSRGWGIDLNYVQNITNRFSVEAALGTVSYALEAAGQKGGLRALTFGAAAQYGRPFGTSRWYVGAGGAYWLNEVTGLGGAAIDDADDSPALFIEGGVEFGLFMRANLDLAFRYTFADSRLSNGDDLDLDAFAARVNCVLLF